MLKKYCGDVTIWAYPPTPYVTISQHFRVPPPPSPGEVLFERPPSDICLLAVQFPGSCGLLKEGKAVKVKNYQKLLW